jgi:hypothetical protein
MCSTTQNIALQAPIKTVSPKKRGRRALPTGEKVINLALCGKESLLGYIQTWNSDKHKGLEEMIEDMKKYRPEGRYSPIAGGSKSAAEAKNAPGTKTSLKREIKACNQKIARLERENARLKERLKSGQ